MVRCNNYLATTLIFVTLISQGWIMILTLIIDQVDSSYYSERL